MVNNGVAADGNGWSQYKLSVMQQLEFLVKEVQEIKKSIHSVDKEIAGYKLMLENIGDMRLSIRSIESEMKKYSLLSKSDADHMAIQLKLEDLFEWKAEQSGKTSKSNTISIIAIIISILLTSITSILHFIV